MRNKINVITQCVLAVAILGGLVYFYWYSRNFIAGYYELSWFAGETVQTGKASIAIFLVPVLAMAGWAIYYRVRRQKE